MDIYCKNIREIKAFIDNEEITIEDINEDILNRLKNKDGNYSVLNPKALEIARELDRKRKSGEKIGTLAGIPVAVEDSISTKGILTQNGSKILEDYIPIFDAGVVEKLYEEDAILVGKANLSEFGIKEKEDIFGTAKAVIDGEAVFGISLDTRGEVRLAAAKHGLIGFRPTYGLISRYGIIAHASTLDQIGITTKNLDDLSLVLNTLISKDKRDSTSVEIEKIDYTKVKDKEEESFKIGVPEEYFEELEEDEKEKLKSLMENLKKLGYEVEIINIPTLEYAKGMYDIISSGEFASNLARYDGISYGYRAEDYENVEELYKKTRTEGFGLGVKEKILFGNFVIGQAQYEKYYVRSQKLRSKLKDEFDNIFKEYDLVLTHIDESSTLGSNLAGLPSMAIPYEAHRDNPLGFQIIADKFGEDALLNFAYNYERKVLNTGGAK